MEMKILKTLLLIFLTNFLIYMFCLIFNLDRTIFNIDYILVVGLLLLHYKKIAHVLWCFVFISDVLLCIRQIFPFFRLEDILYISKFIWISSINYQIACFGFLCYAILHCMLQEKIKINKQTYLTIFILTSFFYISQTIYLTIYPFKKNNFISSQTIEFINFQFYSFQQSLRDERKSLVPFSQSPKATEQLRVNLAGYSHPKNDVLVIIAESLGVPKNKSVLQEIIAPLINHTELRNFKINSQTYVAPTVHAELRELCKVQAQNLNLKKLENGFEQCLPHKFKKLGYETTAMHGALGLMYDRKYWYPRAGFDNVIFQETKLWKTRCYSFPGVCDEELILEIPKQFSRTKPQFFYWLTLNSHAIYDSRDIKIDQFDCMKFNIKPNLESCRNLKLQAQFFFHLAKVLKQPQMRGVDVIVVGDHTPAILNQSEKEEIFDGNNVLILNFTVSNP